MKFFCEYCGNRIDAEIHDKCPNCGASYKKNKNFIKLMEEENEQVRINDEYRQKIFEHVFNTMNTTMRFSKIMFIIPVLVFVIIVSIAITMFIKNQKGFNAYEKMESVIVNFNEVAKINNYSVKVTKYEVVENKFDKPDEGYEYVKFYLMVKNLSDKELTKESVYCIVDGVSQTNDFTSGYSDLPMFIAKDLTVIGTATFMVPQNATSYDIKYGDYITVHIEK